MLAKCLKSWKQKKRNDTPYSGGSTPPVGFLKGSFWFYKESSSELVEKEKKVAARFFFNIS